MTSRTDRKSYRGTHVSVVDARVKNARSPEGQFGRISPPSEAAVRSAIRACICPFCGRGPFHVLALHTYQRHGVDRFELRTLAGMTLNDGSICSSEYAEKHRQLVTARGGIGGPRSAARKPPRFSSVALDRMRANGRAVKGRPATDAQIRAARENGRRRGDQVRKPRKKCIVCGEGVPFQPGNAKKLTCSAKCLRARKAQLMREGRAAGRIAGGGWSTKQPEVVDLERALGLTDLPSPHKRGSSE